MKFAGGLAGDAYGNSTWQVANKSSYGLYARPD
jgi:hypothetical protein